MTQRRETPRGTEAGGPEPDDQNLGRRSCAHAQRDFVIERDVPIAQVPPRKVLLIARPRVRVRAAPCWPPLAEQCPRGHDNRASATARQPERSRRRAAQTRDCRRSDAAAAALPLRVASINDRSNRLNRFDVDHEIHRCEKVGDRLDPSQRSDTRVLRQAIRLDTGDHERAPLVVSRRQCCDRFGKRVEAAVWLRVAEKQPERLVNAAGSNERRNSLTRLRRRAAASGLMRPS